MRTGSWLLLGWLGLCGCEGSRVAPSVVAGKACLSPELASAGTVPTPPRHQFACEVNESDQLGPVLRVARTFGGGQVVSERSERLDVPARTTVHDYSFVAQPRLLLVTRSVDAQGRITREALDDGLDGTIETERTWAFDSDGRLVSEERRDGTSTSGNVKTFGPEGLTLDAWFSNGVPSTSTRWERRPDGVALRSTSFSAPDVLVSTTVWTFDAQQVLQNKEILSARGKRVEFSTYDSHGRTLELRSGWNDVSDSVEQFTWSEPGRLLRDHRFDTLGGEIEDRVATFDAEGHQLTDWHRWGYHFASGPVTDTEVRTVGSCGEVLTSVRTTDGRTSLTAKSTFDDAGHLVAFEQTSFVPSVSTARTLSTFDAAGHLTNVRNESLTAGQWTPTSQRRRVFDEAGHLLLDESTALPSGTRARQAWTFDERGDLVIFESNQNFGHHEVHVLSDYGCWGP